MKKLFFLILILLIDTDPSNSNIKIELKKNISSKFEFANFANKKWAGGSLDVFNYSNATISRVEVAGVGFNVNIGPNSMAYIGHIDISLQGYYISIQTTDLNNIATVNLVDDDYVSGWVPPPGPSGQIVATGMPEDVPYNTFWDLDYNQAGQYILGRFSLVILPE